MEEQVGITIQISELKLNQNDQGFRVLKNCGIQEPFELFVCPISGKLMKDPVIIESGQTYEAESIRKYWRDTGNIRCPKTGQNLSTNDVVPNIVFKELIDAWHNTSPDLFSQQMEEPEQLSTDVVAASAQTFDEAEQPSTGDEETAPNATIEHLIDLLLRLPASGLLAAIKGKKVAKKDPSKEL